LQGFRLLLSSHEDLPLARFARGTAEAAVPPWSNYWQFPVIFWPQIEPLTVQLVGDVTIADTLIEQLPFGFGP